MTYDVEEHCLSLTQAIHMKFGKYTVDLTNTDKTYYPDGGWTKQDVIDYYLDISDHMIPFLRNRPLMMQRFPDGIQQDGFYQKAAADYFPDWIETVSVKKENGAIRHVLCNNKATLVYLVNQGTLAFHAWLSVADKLDHPDKLVIDLDPPGNDFNIVKKGALEIRQLFNNLNVPIYTMTTGSSGLHLYVPLDGRANFDECRDVAKILSGKLCRQHPDLFTDEVRKNKRKGRLFVDLQRNAYAQTGIVPYSLRPLEGGPVATTLSWNELRKKDLNARTWHLGNIRKRLGAVEDPWKGMRRHAIALTTLREKLNRLA